MKTQTINPPIGGYFKHEERVYKAISSSEYGCNGCCFLERLDSGTHFCNAPVSIDCSDKVIKDVTGRLEELDVELIDDPAKKVNIWPLIIAICIGLWTMVIILIAQ